jgi:hypothetical protein
MPDSPFTLHGLDTGALEADQYYERKSRPFLRAKSFHPPPAAFPPCPRSAHRLMTGILRKGQRAAAMAFAFPDPEKGGRGKRKTVEDSSTLFSAKRFQQARYVYGVPILRLIRRYD